MWKRRANLSGWPAVERVTPQSQKPAAVALLVDGVVMIITARGLVGGGAGPAALAWFQSIAAA